MSKKCINCNTIVEDNDKFCSYCGGSEFYNNSTMNETVVLSALNNPYKPTENVEQVQPQPEYEQPQSEYEQVQPTPVQPQYQQPQYQQPQYQQPSNENDILNQPQFQKPHQSGRGKMLLVGAVFAILLIALLVLGIHLGRTLIAGEGQETEEPKDRDDKDNKGDADKDDSENESKDESEKNETETITEDEPQTEPDTAGDNPFGGRDEPTVPSDTDYTKGSIVNGVYQNEWANLQFPVSAEYPQAGAQTYASFEDYKTECGFATVDASTGFQFVITYENLNLVGAAYTAEEYVRAVATAYVGSMSDSGIESTIKGVYTTTLAGETFHYIIISSTINGQTLYCHSYARMQNNYAIGIISTSYDELDILSAVDKLKPMEEGEEVLPRSQSRYTNADTGYGCYIVDQAELIQDSDEAALLTVMKEMSQYCDVTFISFTNNPYDDTKKYLDIYNDTYYNDNEHVMIAFDLDESYLWLYSYGDVADILTKQISEDIADTIVSYADENDFYTCAYVGFDLAAGKIKQAQ